MKRETALWVGIIGSLLFLFGLALAQSAEMKFLDLPVHWLAVAMIPVLVAMIIGRYLTRFKGLGIELEAAVGAPVSDVAADLTASDAVSDIPGDEKQSLRYLHELTPVEKLRKKWLLFRAGRQGYYQPEAVAEYLETLSSLEFLEVRTESDGIVGFLPIRAVMEGDGRPDLDKLRTFIEAVESGTLETAFPGQAVTLQVRSSDSLTKVLATMRAEQVPFAAVVSPRGRYLGVALASELEQRIADGVLAAERAAGRSE